MTKTHETFRQPMSCLLAVAALLFPLCISARAANVVVGGHALLPNTANQVITISVTGGEQIAGEDFFAQIGDGGAINNGVDTKPAFSNVDILGGTIFAGNNTGASGDPAPGGDAAHPLIWDDGTVTASGSVAASGILATLTINTTGLSSGSFPLVLTGVASALGGSNTTLRALGGDAIPLVVTNGSLTISPFPAADYNHNGLVDAADYVVWRESMGQAVTPGSGADGDHDGTVTTADYNLWKSEFGYSAPGSGAAVSAAVPEPRTVGLLAIGGFLVGALGQFFKR
jgi:hypothetical protein